MGPDVIWSSPVTEGLDDTQCPHCTVVDQRATWAGLQGKVLLPGLGAPPEEHTLMLNG